jgi:hypothetical protein
MPRTEPDQSVAVALNRPLAPAGSRPPVHSSPLDVPPGTQVHVKDIRHGSASALPVSAPSLPPPSQGSEQGAKRRGEKGAAGAH